VERVSCFNPFWHGVSRAMMEKKEKSIDLRLLKEEGFVFFVFDVMWSNVDKPRISGFFLKSLNKCFWGNDVANKGLTKIPSLSKYNIVKQSLVCWLKLVPSRPLLKMVNH